MRHLFLILLLALGVSLHAEGNSYTDDIATGVDFAHSATALSTNLISVTPGVASTYTTVALADALYITVTGTAGVLVQFSSVTHTAGFFTAYRLGPGTQRAIRKQGSYVRFVGRGRAGEYAGISLGQYTRSLAVTSFPTATPVTTPLAVQPASVGISSESTTEFTWTTTPVALAFPTPSAGLQTWEVYLEGLPGPCSGAYYEVRASQTPTTALLNGRTAYLPASPTAGVIPNAYSGTGWYLIGRSSSSTDCHGAVQFLGKP